MRRRPGRLFGVLLALSLLSDARGSITLKTEAKAEGGAGGWNVLPLDCTGQGPVRILQATYGLPLGPPTSGCTTTSVPVGNLNTAAGTECDGKEKCIVTSCPCTQTCPPGSTCDKSWADPASKCFKGITVTYRCGDSPWGWLFLAMLALGGGGYLAAGAAYATKVQGRKATGGGAGALLRLHPHFGKWTEVLGLVEDGVAYARGSQQRRGGATSQRSSSAAAGGNDDDARSRRRQEEEEEEEEQEEGGNEGGRGRDKNKQKARQGHRSSGEKKGKKERGKKAAGREKAEPLLAAAPAAPAPTATSATSGGGAAGAGAGGAKATASGGGGRWVHVPT
jgi:hypothetical protein